MCDFSPRAHHGVKQQGTADLRTFHSLGANRQGNPTFKEVVSVNEPLSSKVCLQDGNHEKFDFHSKTKSLERLPVMRKKSKMFTLINNDQKMIRKSFSTEWLDDFQSIMVQGIRSSNPNPLFLQKRTAPASSSSIEQSLPAKKESNSMENRALFSSFSGVRAHHSFRLPPFHHIVPPLQDRGKAADEMEQDDPCYENLCEDYQEENDTDSNGYLKMPQY